MSYENLKVAPEALEALRNFTLPAKQTFGKTNLPILVVADCHAGQWGTLEMVPYGPFEIDPACKVLHYAQEVFEGLKAYRSETLGVSLFRPDYIGSRMNRSAARMGMPEIPEAYFMEAVHAISAYGAPFIPTGSGESLYLRPFMFATEVGLGIAPPEDFRFVVMASPSASYFSEGSIAVLIEREYCRAAPGGMGAAKTGGNYAGGVRATLKAQELGFQQSVWLDAVHRRYVEELSGMNFFAVVDGTALTPELTDTILSGNTRDSLLKLARSLEIPVKETRLDIEELKSEIESGKCTEAFCCGTASIVVPVGVLGDEDGWKREFRNVPGPVASKLKSKLLGIQLRTEPDEFGWVVPVDPV